MLPVRARKLTPLLLLGVVFCDAVSERDLLCEEAAERIRICCDFRPVGLDCVDEPAGCGSPGLHADEARCVADTLCVALRDSGYCRYARAVFSERPATSPPPEPELCR